MRKAGTPAKLTADQIMGYLQSYINKYGYPPSNKEIAAFFDVTNATIDYWLNRLDHFGYIERPNLRGDIRRNKKGFSRAIRIVKRIEGHEYELG